MPTKLLISKNKFIEKRGATMDEILKNRENERTVCERYSRVCGYIRPVEQWNEGKQAEFNDRSLFDKSCE